MAIDGTADIGGLAGLTVELMDRLGAPGAGLAIFLENLFPPLPSEVILPLAGFAARLGHFSAPAAIVWTTLGSVLGAWVIYFLGARLGHERMRRLAVKIPLVDAEDIDRSTAWFARHGTKSVFFARMLPLFRSFISVPAGTARMNFLVFTLLTSLGSLIWNSVFIGAGYVLGANWHRIEPYASTFQYIVLTAIGIAVIWFIASRLRSRKPEADSGPDDV